MKIKLNEHNAIMSCAIVEMTDACDAAVKRYIQYVPMVSLSYSPCGALIIASPVRTTELLGERRYIMKLNAVRADDVLIRERRDRGGLMMLNNMPHRNQYIIMRLMTSDAPLYINISHLFTAAARGQPGVVNAF